MMYNYDSQQHWQDMHRLLMQQIDDEKLEGSGFQFDCFKEVISDI